MSRSLCDILLRVNIVSCIIFDKESEGSLSYGLFLRRSRSSIVRAVGLIGSHVNNITYEMFY